MNIAAFTSGMLQVPCIVWQLLFLSSWWLVCFLVAFRKKYGNYLVSIVPVLTLLVMLPLSQAYTLSKLRSGVIKVPSAYLYLGPDVSYPIRAKLDHLQEVHIGKRIGKWLFVKSVNGDGWLLEESCELSRYGKE